MAEIEVERSFLSILLAVAVAVAVSDSRSTSCRMSIASFTSFTDSLPLSLPLPFLPFSLLLFPTAMTSTPPLQYAEGVSGKNSIIILQRTNFEEYFQESKVFESAALSLSVPKNSCLI